MTAHRWSHKIAAHKAAVIGTNEALFTVPSGETWVVTDVTTSNAGSAGAAAYFYDGAGAIWLIHGPLAANTSAHFSGHHVFEAGESVTTACIVALVHTRLSGWKLV